MNEASLPSVLIRKHSDSIELGLTVSVIEELLNMGLLIGKKERFGQPILVSETSYIQLLNYMKEVA